MKVLRSKTTKVELRDDGSFVNVILVDEDGEKYVLPLEVKELYNDDFAAFTKQIAEKAQKVKEMRLERTFKR